MVNPYVIAASITMDTVVLGKQRGTSWLLLSSVAIFTHISAYAVGLFLGSSLTNAIGFYDHWLAMALFGYLGLNCFKAVFTKSTQTFDTGNFFAIVIACFGFSIDAAAVGATTQNIIKDPLQVILGIALFTPLFIYLGKKMGHFLKRKSDIYLKIAEGVIFWSIGIGILVSHASLGI